MAKRTFSDWYKENKERLSAERKKKYAEDAGRREAAREYQRDYRTRTSSSAPQFTGLTRADLCDNLEITPWVLNSWRNKGYYPEPTRPY